MIKWIDFIFFDCRKTLIIIVLHLYNNNIVFLSLCSWEMCQPILLKWWTKCKECMPGRTTWTSGPSTAPKKVGFDTSFFFMVLEGHIHVVLGPMWDLMCIVHLVIFLHLAMICFNHVQRNLAMFYYQIFTYSMFRCSLYKIKKHTKNEFIESFGQRQMHLVYTRVRYW